MTCPKCGEGQMGSPIYRIADPYGYRGERLERACPVCGYTTSEPTKDADIKKTEARR